MMCGCRLTAKELFSSLLRKKCAEVKPSTAQRYRFLIEKHILPELGHLRVEQLTAKKLQAFLQRKRVNGGLKGGGLSVKTVRDIGTLIKSALKYAQAEFSVPCDADALRLPSPTQAEICVFTEDELRRMAEQVMRKPQPIEIGILLALNTGLRIGELCALQRQDIDFTAGTVSVRNTAQRINYGGRTKLVVQTPKSAASNRVIPIPAEMLTLLRQYVYAFAPGAQLEAYRTITRQSDMVLAVYDPASARGDDTDAAIQYARELKRPILSIHPDTLRTSCLTEFEFM